MVRKIQSYSKEFRIEAVKTVLEQGLSISKGASLLSIPEDTLGQWLVNARKEKVAIFSDPFNTQYTFLLVCQILLQLVYLTLFDLKQLLLLTLPVFVDHYTQAISPDLFMVILKL